MHAGAQDLFRLPAICGSASWASVKLVRTQRPAYIRPGLSTRWGSKLSLIRRVRAARAGACGWKTRAQRARTAASRGSAWRGRRWRATAARTTCCAGARRRRQRQPDQPAGPVVEHLAAGVMAAPPRRRGGGTDSRQTSALGVVGKRLTSRTSRQSAASFRRSSSIRRPNGPAARRARPSRKATDGRGTFQPQHGRRQPPRRRGRRRPRRGDAGRQMGRARDVEGEPIAARHRLRSRAVVEAENDQGRVVFRRRQHADRDFGR